MSLDITEYTQQREQKVKGLRILSEATVLILLPTFKNKHQLKATVPFHALPVSFVAISCLSCPLCVSWCLSYYCFGPLGLCEQQVISTALCFSSGGGKTAPHSYQPHFLKWLGYVFSLLVPLYVLTCHKWRQLSKHLLISFPGKRAHLL